MDEIKECINDFVECMIADSEGYILLDEFKHAEDYLGTSIRISVSNLSDSEQTDYFYYDPESKKVIEGPAVMGNTMNYGYKNVGMVEFYFRRTTGNSYIMGVSRVVLPEDEDMEYADEFEESIFNNLDINRFDRFSDPNEIHLSCREKYKEKAKTLLKCIDCGKLIFPSDKNLEVGPEAKAIELLIDYYYSVMPEALCIECGKDLTVKNFLEKYSSHDKIDRFTKTLKDEYSLESNDSLFY